jgi:hypothetical protein
MAKLQVPPPFVPQIKSSTDIQNIDKMFTRERPKETPEESSYL